MTYESSGNIVIDEIDCLFVVYDKAKEYINKILNGIEKQSRQWQHRRQIIIEQMQSVSSFDFLLPKTQRINQLTIETVQALCRVDLLMEQILRIDPKESLSTNAMPISTSFSARLLETNLQQKKTNSTFSRLHQPVLSPSLNSIKQPQLAHAESISSGKTLGKLTFPTPVLRTPQSMESGRFSVAATQEKFGFKPIEQQRSSTISDTTPRPTPIHPQSGHYQADQVINFTRSPSQTYNEHLSQSERNPSPLLTDKASQQMSNYQPPRDKTQVKLQRISPGTKWKPAKIDIIDSLSAFYVENLDSKVHKNFFDMLSDLNNHYNNLERANKLFPLENICIGDFGVARYSEDKHWYRARILTSDEHDRVRIVFIDFGNIESKDISEFFPLDKDYTNLPAQAIACTLSEAYPHTPDDSTSPWPQNTIEIFKNVVIDKIVEVVFVNAGEGADLWPLHFVQIIVDNQTVTNFMALKQYIEPRPNKYIAEQLSNYITQQEYILFNIPISDNDRY